MLTRPHRYGRILHRILDDASKPEKEDALKVLGWLCVAKLQLKWHEIQAAISIDLESKTIDVENRRLSVDAKDLCGSLIEIQSGNTIALVHSTARQ